MRFLLSKAVRQCFQGHTLNEEMERKVWTACCYVTAQVLVCLISNIIVSAECKRNGHIAEYDHKNMSVFAPPYSI